MNLILGLSFFGNLAVALFILICVGIILIVLLQKGRGGGISAAFGGGGAGSLLGTKTGDFLTWVTICLVAVFLVLAVLMGKFMRPTTSADLAAQPVTAPVPAPEGTTPPEAAPMPETSQPAPDTAPAAAENSTALPTTAPQPPAETTEPAN